MECTPFNISVVLLAPGLIQSKITSNSAEVFKVPEGSLWKPYLPQILRLMDDSQALDTMPTTQFAQETVNAILDKRGPPRYMSIGGHALLFKILLWMPRGLVLWFFWKKFGEASQ